jgi:hypothetical protein
MKKFSIVIAVVLSAFAFCTKDSPTQVSTNGGYTDSIIVDLFTYNYFADKYFPAYFPSTIITPLGQPFFKPLDSMLLKPLGDLQQTVILTKYSPIKFEAWVYDSIPLVDADSTDPKLVIKQYSSSSNYFYRLDTSSTSADRIVNNANESRRVIPVNLTYYYGFGFIITDKIYWGIGKIKIYYK